MTSANKTYHDTDEGAEEWVKENSFAGYYSHWIILTAQDIQSLQMGKKITYSGEYGVVVELEPGLQNAYTRK